MRNIMSSSDRSRERTALRETIGILALAGMGYVASAGIGLVVLMRDSHKHDRSADPGQASPPPMALPERSVDFLRSRRAYMRACQLAGDRLEIEVEFAPELLREVQRHRWLEAEKAGRDIWSEIEPAKPERAALRDWLAKHYAGWRDWKRQGMAA